MREWVVYPPFDLKISPWPSACPSGLEKSIGCWRCTTQYIPHLGSVQINYYYHVFAGKMIESLEAHQKTKLIYCVEDQLDALASPFLKKLAILDDTTLMATYTKENIELNRPVAIGVSILELSKRFMYSFLYDVIYPFYGGPEFVQPMYMDTGILTQNIFTSESSPLLQILSS